jgi:hypothetical protein
MFLHSEGIEKRVHGLRVEALGVWRSEGLDIGRMGAYARRRLKADS